MNVERRSRKGRTANRLRLETLEPRRLLTAEVEPNDSPNEATPIVFEDSVAELSGDIASIDDLDFFELTLAQGQQLKVHPRAPSRHASIQLLDSYFTLQATSSDAEGFTFVSPDRGTYYLRLSGEKNYTQYVGQYEAIEIELSLFDGTTETEPNDVNGYEDEISDGSFRGRLDGDSDVDVYAFDAVRDDAVVVQLAGSAENHALVEIVDANGDVLASSSSGGLTHEFAHGGKYHLRVSQPQVRTVELYVGNFGIVSNPLAADPSSVSFDHATPIELARDENLIGRLDVVDDVRWFMFEKAEFDLYEFQLEFNAESIPAMGRAIALYDSSGRHIKSATHESMRIVARDPSLVSDRYFLSVRATHETGLGAFAVRVERTESFPSHRDVPLYFLDFAQHQSHLGHDWAGPMPSPEAIPLLTERLRAWYSNHEVEITLDPPTSEDEVIANGHGDFGSIGAAGYGAGAMGVRQPSGESVTTFKALIKDYDARNIEVLLHEAGHATGLPHHRHPLALLAYDRDAFISPVGEVYTFSTEPSDANAERINPRDYVDRALTPGRQIAETQDASFPQRIDTPWREMTVEMTRESRVEVAGRLTHIVEADFNGDGWRDVAAADHENNQIVTMLNDGHGRLMGPNYVSVPPIDWWNESLATADFNNDGHDDLAVISNDTQAIQVLLGTSSGELQKGDLIKLDVSPASIATADLTGDTTIDLAIGASGQILVLTGLGDGSFSRSRASPAPSTPYSISIADLNGDGKLDLVTANQSNQSISSFLNNGDGRLRPPISADAGASPYSVTTADFNQDGIADVAVADRFDEMLSVLFGQGDGSFGQRTDYALGFGAYHVKTDDINQDGLPDIAIGNYDDQLRLMISDEAGRLSAPIAYPSDQQPAGVVITDLDLDGRRDVVTANSFGRSLNIFQGRPNDPRNDRTIVFGSIQDPGETDNYLFFAEAGDQLIFDIEAAEFQSSLDASLTVYDQDGQIVAQSMDARDRDSGIYSDDPFLLLNVPRDGEYRVEIRGQRLSAGFYRLKFFHQESRIETGPRLIHMQPQQPIQGTRQINMWFNDQLSPSSLTPENIQVVGTESGRKTGTVVFDPLRSLLNWRADAQLPPDRYIVTLKSGPNGITNLDGTPLDGELPNDDLSFPNISGDGQPGGDLTFTFEVTSADVSPAQVIGFTYERDPYNRSQFNLDFDDVLDLRNVHDSSLVIRGDGADRQFNTGDDTFPIFDPWFEVSDSTPSRLNLFARGILDPGQYRIEGTIVDAAGHSITVEETHTVNDDFHGPSVVDVTRNENVEGYVESISVRFNGLIDVETVTTHSVGVRYSADPQFFDGDDEWIADADGDFQWDATLSRIVWMPAVALHEGYYQLHVKSGVDGVRDHYGRMLDGEFLNAMIPGSDSPFIWNRNPSGDGVPGGDFRETFVVAAPMAGDLDGDGTANEADLIRMCHQLDAGDYERSFDVNGDGDLTFNDFRYLVETQFGTAAGDANLDRQFDSSDLIEVFQQGRFERDDLATWHSGDWNCDGRFTTADLILAFASNPYVTSGSPSGVKARPDIVSIAAAVDAFFDTRLDSVTLCTRSTTSNRTEAESRDNRGNNLRPGNAKEIEQPSRSAPRSKTSHLPGLGFPTTLFHSTPFHSTPFHSTRWHARLRRSQSSSHPEDFDFARLNDHDN